MSKKSRAKRGRKQTGRSFTNRWLELLESRNLLTASLALTPQSVPEGTDPQLTLGTLTTTSTGLVDGVNAFVNVKWGDANNTSTVGHLTATGNPSQYVISGSPGSTTVYPDEGNFTETVTVTDGTNAANDATGTASVSVTESDNLTPIANQPVIVTGTALPFNGPVAVFSDTGNPNQTIADVTALVNWGDGNSSFGMVTKDPITGLFTVSGQHSYTVGGNYAVRVATEDFLPGTDFGVAHNTATVISDTATLTALPVLVGEQATFTGQVATMSEPGATFPANSFTATINWGDGASSAGTVTGSNGTYAVNGSHTYADDGHYTITVTAAGTGANITPAVTGTSTADVAENDLTVTALPIQAGENQQFNGAVATFTDPSAKAGDTFTALINWGDNTSSQGVVSGSAGAYTVTGSHTYTEDGHPNTSVLVTENGVSQELTAVLSGAFQIPPVATPGMGTTNLFLSADQTTLTVTGSFNNLLGNVTAAHLHNAPIFANGPLATDANGNPIDFNGVPMAPSGTIPQQSFQVTPAFVTQLFEGNIYQNIHTTVFPNGEIRGQFFSHNFASNTADVAETDIAVTALPVSVGENVKFSGNVATFSDPGALAGDSFTASIQWGDGGAATTGTVTGSNGNYTVAGNHTYAEDGNYTMTVTATENGVTQQGMPATATAIATVLENDASITPQPVTSAEGQPFSGTLGVLNDPGSTESASAFKATVDWGDGTVSAATLTGTSGAYTITGGHTFAEDGHYTVKLSASETGISPNPIATATATASVAEDDITVTALPITIGEKQAFNGNVATFTDASATAADTFSSEILWGDNSVSIGTVSGSGGQYTVSGGHTYAEDGSYPVNVLVTENGVTNQAPSSSSMLFLAQLSGAQQVPPTVTPATGTGALRLSANQTTITLDTSFAGLLGIPTAAHLHNAPPGQNGPLATDVNGNPIEFTNIPPVSTGTLAEQSFTVNPAFVNQLLAGNIYENIHTTIFPTGEIRGQVSLVKFANAGATATVLETDATITPQNILVGEGKPFSGMLGLLSDPGSLDPASAYKATVDWGDGTVSAATLTGTNGAYTITGSHTYVEDGHYTIKLTASETDISPNPIATMTSTADVAEDDLTVTAVPIAIGEHNQFSGTVASFADPGATAGDTFTATVNWGDNTVTAGVISGSGGQFTVAGTHTYADDGKYPVSVLVTENGVSQVFTATLNNAQEVPPGIPFPSPGTGMATLFLSADQTTLTASSNFTNLIGLPIAAHLHNAPAGANGPIATDANGNNIEFIGVPPLPFGAVPPQTFHVNAAFVTQLLAGNIYENIHTTLFPSGEIRGQFNSNNVGSSTASVSENDATITGLTVHVGEGLPFSGPVAVINDPGSSDVASDFTVTVNWGDGTIGAGTVIGGAGSYTVSGTHTYATTGHYTITVSAAENGVAPNPFATGISTADVAEDDLAVTANPVAIGENQQFNGAVATFTDPGAVQTYSTVPSNGDVNPYGVAIVPSTFPNTGILQPGDTLVANFNSAGNVQGTGTTITRITAAGQQSAFYTSTALGLDTGLVVLKSGFVIVANVPNAGNGTLLQGSLQVLDNNGNLVETISNSTFLNDPWDLAVNDQGSTVQLFASNVSGVTGPNGTVTRVDLTVPAGGIPQVHDMVQIGSGYRTRLDMNAFVVGPGGLAYDPTADTLYVASQAEMVNGTETGTIFSIAHAGTTNVANGKGTVVFADATHLHGPIGLVLAPNGNLITANSDAVNTDPNQPSELVEFTKSGQFVGQFSVDPANGGAFGLAIGTIGGEYRLAAVDDNAANISLYDFQPTSPTVNSYSATIGWGDNTTGAGTITFSGGTFTVTGSHTYAEDGHYPVSVLVTENGASQLFTTSLTGGQQVPPTNSPATGATSLFLSADQTKLTVDASFSGLMGFPTAAHLHNAPAGANGPVATDANGNNIEFAGLPAAMSGTIPQQTFVVNAAFVPQLFQSNIYQNIHTTAFPNGEIRGQFLSSNFATSSADVAEDDISVTAVPITIGEHKPFSGAVATFADPSAIAADTFTATISWGDGGGTTIGTVSGSIGQYTVTGSHTYADDGSYPVTISVTENGVTQQGPPASATATATVLENDASLMGQSILVGEGQHFSGALGVLSDPGSTEPASSYNVTIDWGDGTVGPAALSGTNGTYTVTGSHTYVDDGHYTVHLTASEYGVSPSPIATASITADVAEDDLTVTALPITIGEHNLFSGAVATFSDPSATAGDTFTATINWGDTTVSAGVVSGSAGRFTVTGSHTYADDGNYPVSVLVTENDVSQLFTATLNNAQQVPPAIPIPSAATGTAELFLSADQTMLTMATSYAGLTTPPIAAHLHNAPAGQNGPVATDANGNNLAFTSLPATTSGSLGPQSFKVNATFVTQLLEGNTYENIHDAVFPTGEIRGQFTSSNFATTTATVQENDATLTGQTILAAEKQAFSGQVAVLSDPGSTDATSAYNVTIDWGDGTVSAGTISGSNGAYTVTGNHTYAVDGRYPIHLTASETGVTPNPIATAAGTAAVAEDDLAVKLLPLQITEGTQFSGAMATFSDPTATANDAFTATVNWGDNTTTAGVITGSAGSYTVSGTHTYADEGNFPLSVLVTENGVSQVFTTNLSGAQQVPPIGSLATGTATLFLSADQTTLTASSNFAGLLGIPTAAHLHNAPAGANGPIAMDANGNNIEFAGVPPVPVGAIGPQTFAVNAAFVSQLLAGNIYENIHTTTFPSGEIRGQFVPANFASGTLTVAEGDTIAAVPIAGLAFPLSTSFGNILATFTDTTYPTNPPNDFTTTVNWGDGTSSAGTITALGNGNFMVTGNHAYTSQGNFSAAVTISDPSGTATATVNDAILVPTLTALLEPCDFDPATGLPSPGMQQLAVFGTPNDDHIQINLQKNPQGQLSYSVTIDSNSPPGPGQPPAHFQVNNVVVSGSLCKLEVFGLNGNDTIQVQSDNTNTPEWIFGGTGNDMITVDDGNDVVVGGGGKNQIQGGDGRDLLIGGNAPSSITGAQQDSILIGGTTNFDYDSQTLAQVMAEWSSADSFATRMAKLATYLNANTVQQVAGGDTVHSGNGNDWIFNNGKIFTTNKAEDVTHDPLIGTPETIAATAGAVFSGPVVTFTASDPASVPIDFEAVIDWGNGNVSIGTVAASGGGFVVSGANTYASAGSDSVQVSIESLSGDTASITATATVAAAPTAPPLTPLQAFVSSAFQDVLGRAVDPTALTYYLNALQNGESHLQFALGLTLSDEYLDDEITAAYQHFLGRAPDDQGLNYWLGQLRGGMTLEMMQAQFIGAPEYYQHSGGTDKAWVDHMYFDLLGRAPDNQGEAYWVGVLADGGSKALVALGFAASPEREGIIVRNDYALFLHRAPGQPEVDRWVNAFEQGMSNETVVAGLIASDEYFARFGTS